MVLCLFLVVLYGLAVVAASDWLFGSAFEWLFVSSFVSVHLLELQTIVSSGCGPFVDPILCPSIH